MTDRSRIEMTADVSGGSTSIMAGRDVIITYGSPPTEQFEDDPVGECPYPGLSSFGPGQAGWFFGRHRVLGALRVRLDRARADGGPVVLIGGSGAGKSSLLRCGLIDSVTVNGFGDAGSRTWPQVVCTPTDAPVAALAAALAPLVDAPADRLAAEWRDDPVSCAAMLRGALGSRRVLLVVDQFEELFASSDGDAAFVDLLDHLCAGADAPAMVVLGLRADYYGHCLTHPWLAAALRDEPIQLGPLSRAELELVVLGPAAEVGLSVQPALVQVLLADMGSTALPGEDGAGRLPLLAHGLRATWLKRTGKTLTLDGYRDTGGIQGAIATTADRTFGKLSDAGQQAARSVFLRLVRIGLDTEDTRRRVALDDLVGDLPEGRAVVAAYTAQRLLTVDRDGVTITHEALLRAWGTLRAWIEADRAGHLFRQELDAHVLAWQAGMRGLHQGATLHNAELWAQRHPQDVSPAIARFLAASRRTVNRRRRAWQAATAVVLVLALVAAGAAVYAFNQRDQANAQRATAVALLVAAEAQNLAVSQPGVAKQLALIAARLSSNTGDGALLAAAESPGMYDSQDSILDVAQTRDGRTLALATSNGIALWSTAGHADARITGVTAVGPVALSPNGRVLAAVVRDGLNSAVRLWSVADPARPQPLVTLPVVGGDAESVAVSATSTVLAVGTATGPIRLWTIANPAAPHALPSLSGHPGGVDSLAFDPAAPVLASSGADHLVRLWSTANPAAPALLSTMDGYHGGNDDTNDTPPNYTFVHHRIAFSPNGTTLAAPGDVTNSYLRLWSMHDPARPQLLTAPGNDAYTFNSASSCGQSIRSVAFAWDGKLLATACGSITSLWQADGLSKVAVAYTFPVNEQSGPAFFTADKYTMLDATHAGLQDWDVTNPDLPGAPASIDHGATGPDATVTFSGGKRKLFAAGGSDIGLIWDLGRPRPEVIAHLPGLRGAGVAFRPDGNVIADGENINDGQGLVLRLRDTTKPGAPMLATMSLQIQDGIESLAFSPDGHTLALADSADVSTIKLFDVTDPSRPHLIATQPADALHVGFSPDGHLLVATTPDALLSWNVSDPRQPVALPTEQLDINGNVLASASFSPDGHVLAVGSDSGRVRLWRVNGDRLIGSPTVFEAPGFTGGIAFSPGSRTVALVDNGTTPGSVGTRYVQFWDVANPTGPILQAQFSVGDTFTGGSLAFSADGQAFAIDVNGVILWNTHPGAATVCGSIGDVITPDQWARYVPNEPYDPPCGS